MAWNQPSIVNHDSYLDFKNATIGQGWDMDNYAGCQCWDGVDLLYFQYGQTLSTGNVGSVYACWQVEWARNLNGSGEFEIVSNINDIKQGDIVVLASTPSVPDGHIAFADEDYSGGSSLNLYGTNQYPYVYPDGGQFVVTTFSNFSSLFLGGFRNKNWATPPTPPHIWSTPRQRDFPFIVAKTHWNMF